MSIFEYFRQKFVRKSIFEMSPHMVPQRNLKTLPWESVMFKTEP